MALLRSRAIAPQVQELSPLCLEMDQESAGGKPRKASKPATTYYNVLITKRLSIIAPKSHDNPYGVTFAI